ncbi:hypothetical protein LTR92_001439 [Exophiala xenobiotica]|nr:hypothetical protein LTR92_001439 [Exophiala xenobiotica]
MSDYFGTEADAMHNTDHALPSEQHFTEVGSTAPIMSRAECGDLTIQKESQNAAAFSKSVDCPQSPPNDMYPAASVLQWIDMDISPIPEPFHGLQASHDFCEMDVAVTSQTSLAWPEVPDICPTTVPLPLYSDAVPAGLAPSLPDSPFGSSAQGLSTQPSVPGCFLLEQVDPLEAKSNELRLLLNSSNQASVAGYVTRENLLVCLQLYGKHFQNHFPILHSATFSVSTASPILLLAIFCVGASYAKHIMNQKDIFTVAMFVLSEIGRQPHESLMEQPPLSTIQANMAACCVLACSQDETAAKFVPVCVARSISMAKRAGVFEPLGAPDYRTLTDKTFDWHWWIEHETRTRIASCLFTQDAAGCIFQGNVPSLSPLDLEVELPTYESVWHSRTATECLQKLRTIPSQLTISAGMRLLRTTEGTDQGRTFEASAFGMFTLLTGLHSLTWHTVHYDAGLLPDAGRAFPDPSFPGLAVFDVAARLDQDLSGPGVTTLAAEVLSSHEGTALFRINQALDVWMHSWDRRQYRDLGCENIAFCLDPLPLWFLAKLFLILHCGASFIPAESEYANVRARGIGTMEKLKLQGKVFGWLAKFRDKGDLPTKGAISLTDLMTPMTES